MCAIIDANQAADFCNEKPYFHLETFRAWMGGGGNVAIGGKLTEELSRITKMRKLLVAWERNGQAKIVRKEKVEPLAKKLEKKCKSDDPHVLALINIAKVGVIITNDHPLISDIKNRSLVPHPCKIIRPTYENAASRARHEALLKASGCG